MPSPVLDVVQWYEGMLLLPQHFQQSDRRIRQMFWYHLSHLAPYYYGIVKFKADPALFTKGIVHILELEMVMQDGFVIYFESKPDFALEIDLTGAPEHSWSGNTLMLHIGTLRYREGESNCDGPLARFQSIEGDMIVDENTGTNPVSFPRLRPKLFLLAGETPPPEFISMPLMRVMKKDESFFATDFIPPQLAVSRNSPLGGLCMELIQHIREKVSFLTDKVKNPSTNSPGGDFSIALRTLISTLIPFEAMLYSEHNGPFQLYLGLCTIAGQISSLNPTLILPTFAPYNHKNLRATFTQVTDYCHETLNQIKETYKIIKFDQEERVFKMKLPQPWLTPILTIGVEIHQTFGENEGMEWIKSAIIGSENYLRGIRDKRVLGAPRNVNLKDGTFKNASGAGILMVNIQLSPEYTDPLHPLIITNISDTIEKRPKGIYLYAENNVS